LCARDRPSTTATMGGNAFPDLNTPRMPPGTYYKLKHRILTLLKFHFKYVHTPIEACNKQDYGDLDFIVCEALTKPEPPTDVKPSKKHTPQFKTESVAAMVSATYSKRVGSYDSWNFAITWPESDLFPDFEADEEHSSNTNRARRFVQVDVTVMNNLEDLKWMGWMHAHGDLNMIITLMVRRKSLRISEKGFFASIREIEKISPNLAEVFITKDPDQVMRFLGLDVSRFNQPFKTWDDLMDYAASCRFHNPGYGRKSSDNSGVNTPLEEGKENEKSSVQTGADPTTTIGALDQVKKDDAIASISIPAEFDCFVKYTSKTKVDLELSNTDKKRRVLRPMYRYWIDEYIPAHVDDLPGSAAFMTKSQTLAEAKEFFGQNFAQRYEEKRATNMKRALEPKLWREMRTFFNYEEDGAGIATTTFKGWKRELTADVEDVMGCLDVEGLVEARQAFVDMEYEKCVQWGKEQSKNIWARQAKIDKDKSDAGLRAKLEREVEEAKAKEEAVAVAVEAVVDS
jgi:hypothetical protein